MDIADLGYKIRKFREAKGYTQEFLAEQLGLSLSGYGRIERNETELTVNRLQEIAKILEIPMDTILNSDTKYIFYRPESIQQQSYVMINENTELKVVIDLYERLIKEKEHTISLLKNLLDSQK